MLFRYSDDISLKYLLQRKTPENFITQKMSISTVRSLTDVKQTETEEKNAQSANSLDSEEAQLTQAAINKAFDRFCRTEEYQELIELQRGDKIFPDKRRESQFLDLVEMILQLYYVKFHVPSEFSDDSAMCLIPIESEEQLKRYISFLLPVLVKCPSTMFKRFGINLFTFCHSVELKKAEFKDIYIKKVMRGLFSIGDDESPSKIKRHLYKMICYHLSTLKKGFNDRWKSLNVPGFGYNKKSQDNVKRYPRGFLNEESMRSILDDQIEILDMLLRDDKMLLLKSDDIVKKKTQLMMDTLIAIEPNFSITADWAH